MYLVNRLFCIVTCVIHDSGGTGAASPVEGHMTGSLPIYVHAYVKSCSKQCDDIYLDGLCVYLFSARFNLSSHLLFPLIAALTYKPRHVDHGPMRNTGRIRQYRLVIRDSSVYKLTRPSSLNEIFQGGSRDCVSANTEILQNGTNVETKHPLWWWWVFERMLGEKGKEKGEIRLRHVH